MTRVLAACCACLAVSCSDLVGEPVSGPVDVLVYARDAQADAYRPVRAKLQTLHDLRTLSGDAAKLIGHAAIDVDRDALGASPPTDADALRTAVVRDPGGPVDFAWFTVDGIVHPEDEPSVQLATLYFNMETAKAFYDDLGVELFATTVYVEPTWREGHGKQLVERFDNALFDPVSRTFSILKTKELTALPPAMNLGIVAHEYAHAVFITKVFPSDAGLTWLQQRALTQGGKWASAHNLARSLDEGIADFLAGAVTDDPAFLAKTIPAAKADRTLTPADIRCLDNVTTLSAANDDPEFYDPYPMGAVLAAALWQASEGAANDRGPFARSLVPGEERMGQVLVSKGEAVTLADLVDALLADIVFDLKPVTCALVLDRLGLTVAEVPACTGLPSIPVTRKCPK